MKRQLSVLEIAHKYLRENVRPGDICIDATCGRGFDTKLLCELTGQEGRVIGFDIQQEAIDSANALLKEHQLSAELYLESHANMAKYAEDNTVSCIVFNFGWLPKGNHEIFTRAESSIAALDAGLRLLKQDGSMVLCVYYGRNNGFTERDAILKYLEELDSRYYTVLQCTFPNRTGCPPFVVFVKKDGGEAV
ncbi:MAG: methyltransferase domain-containing protein [Oscillospiraceae bacterium]|nr:methyltransferase domain-containing protein [Oscillospiraceae bacterium]